MTQLMEELSDAEVIRESVSEPTAFALIFERHFRAVHAYLARRAGPDAGSDLAAETFTAAFDARVRYDGRASSLPWLLGIATNLVRHHWRSEARYLRALARATPEDTIDDDATTIAARVDAMSLREPLLEALAHLPAAERDVVLLVAWADVSYADVARALAIPIGTVRSRLSRARGRLRRKLLVPGDEVADAVPAKGY